MTRIISTSAAIFLLTAFLSGQAAPAKPAGQKSAAAHGTRVVSFKRDILPALQDHCMACHFQKDQWPGMDLSTDRAYLTLVNHKGQLSGSDMLVKPVDPVHSFLINKLSDKPRVGKSMPPYGKGLSPQEQHLLAEWIKQGARNN